MTVVERPEITKRANFALGALSKGVQRAFSGPSRRQSTFAPRLIEVILVILLSILLALICLRIFSPLPLPAGEPMIAANNNVSVTEEFVLKNPFPVTDIVPLVADTAPEVVDTTLDLTLTGVWVEEGGGSATIETPDGDQSRFAVGDEIVNGVTLETVYPDQVIINRNGAREALRFNSKMVAPTIPSTPIAEPISAPTRNLAGDNDQPATFANFLRLAPASDSEGNFAVEIYAARDRQTFNDYGFRDGDRVVSINGTSPPADPAALVAMMSSLQRDSQALIVISRNDREIPIRLSLDRTRTQ